MDPGYTESEEGGEQQTKGHSRSHLSLGQSTVDYRSLQLGDNGRAAVDPTTKASSLLVCWAVSPCGRSRFVAGLS